jgi:hypothetical protein
VSQSNDPPIGFDLVEEEPQYGESWEEYWERYSKKHYEVYGVYPEKPSELNE